MRIGDLSLRTGVSRRLLRYYEEQGLLAPRRLPGGYRAYEEADVGAVRSIRALLAAGLGTRTIAGLLPCTVDEGRGPAPLCAGWLPELLGERERLDAAIDGLTAARDALDRIIALTPRTDPGPAAASEGAP
ncbi:MerR family transcriptional regulator [Streptomyces sp. NPDC002454]|uniref:MerR family transcriptional regulator n=1 Tax=Streptomyces sp. NPDC002490 TaxID=3154416 RepID=UPI0033244340